jgi:CrcB protein
MPEWLTTFCTHPITLLMFGGGVGTNVRYWLGKAVREFQGLGVRFPWATFIINVSGSAILGLLAAKFLYPTKGSPTRDPVAVNWYLLLGTGFCGGFTTFSTFSVETFELIQEDRSLLAALYVFGSVGAGLLGAWIAIKVASP